MLTKKVPILTAVSIRDRDTGRSARWGTCHPQDLGTDPAAGREAARQDISTGACCWSLGGPADTGRWALRAQGRVLGWLGPAAGLPSSGTLSACLSAWTQIRAFARGTRLPRRLARGERDGLPEQPCNPLFSLSLEFWNFLSKDEPPSQHHHLGRSCPLLLALRKKPGGIGGWGRDSGHAGAPGTGCEESVCCCLEPWLQLLFSSLDSIL